MSEKFVVRLWDMFDGWIDCHEGSLEVVTKYWNKKTNHGSEKTNYSEGDYYRIFPADTQMLMTPEYFGR